MRLPAALALATLFWVPGSLQAERLMLRVAPGSLDAVLARYTLTLERTLRDPQGELHLVIASSTAQTNTIDDDPDVLDVETIDDIELPEVDDDEDLGASTAPLLEALAVPTLVEFYDSTAWTGYVEQPAAQLIESTNVHDLATGEDVTVAIIDTGVDPDHPLLRDTLVRGYDFLRDEPGFAPEWVDLNPAAAAQLQQSVAWILEDVGVVRLNQSVAWILEQSVAWILEDYEVPAAFGHGTMVAGLIRLVAPEARILPLKAFSGDGAAQTVDVVRAIYHAVDADADVINMSFSIDAFSPEILRAVNYAVQNGVICVAAAGNRGEETLVYPAALGNVIGVGSTSLDDERSAFTNFGDALVTLAAPGEALITAFPGGGAYAAGWGTSFSAPLVSGTVALLLSLDEEAGGGDDDGDDSGSDTGSRPHRFLRVLENLSDAQEILGQGLGYGRLQTSEAVGEAVEGDNG